MIAAGQFEKFCALTSKQYNYIGMALEIKKRPIMSWDGRTSRKLKSRFKFVKRSETHPDRYLFERYSTKTGNLVATEVVIDRNGYPCDEDFGYLGFTINNNKWREKKIDFFLNNDDLSLEARLAFKASLFS